MQAAILTDSPDAYADRTQGLRRSLQAVLEGPLGRMYDGQSTARLATDTPMVSVDVSAVSRQLFTRPRPDRSAGASPGAASAPPPTRRGHDLTLR